MTKTLRLIALPAALTLLAAGTASAQTHNIKSTLAISDRVEVPGAILEPGTYLVRVAEKQADRNTVVFQSLDGTKTFATAMATPHPEHQSKTETEFVFYPTSAGETRVLRSWYPPNDRFAGQDFVYPADRMAALRKSTSTEVPVATADTTSSAARSTETTRTDDMRTSDMNRSTAPSTVRTDENRTADMNRAPAPATDRDTMARTDTRTTEDNRVAETSARPRSLPRTASPLPAAGVLGLVFLAAGSLLACRPRVNV
jgi:hypothetical protein